MGKGIGSSNTVLTLLAGKKAWTPLASLPRSLYGSRASLVEEKMRVVGGQQGEEGAEGDYRNEVKTPRYPVLFQRLLQRQFLNGALFQPYAQPQIKSSLILRCLNMRQGPLPAGSRLGSFGQRELIMLS